MSVSPDHLCTTTPPWLLKAEGSFHLLLSEIQAAIIGRGLDLRVADAWMLRSLGDVFDRFQDIYEFPEYYGHNSAAFEECMADLSWIPAKGYVLVICHASSLLSSELEELTWLTNVFQDLCSEWSRPVELGVPWDRPATPFHVVFQYQAAEAQRLPQGIAATPMLLWDRADGRD
jgi:hypothetical protein